MKVPTVLEELTDKLYVDLTQMDQPRCTILTFEDSTGRVLFQRGVGVSDIYRLLDVLRDTEFLDNWATEKAWMPSWPDDPFYGGAVGSSEQEGS